MKTFLLFFFSIDIRIRAAVILALFIMIFWWALGKIIIRLASILPYLLRIVFKGAYLMIEVPICCMHERFGSFFCDIDNGLAGAGDRIDTFLNRWYACWRNPESGHIFLSMAVYCVLLIWICIPYHADEANSRFPSGQGVYLSLENKLTHWLETKNLYEERIAEVMNYEEPEPEEDNSNKVIVMKVITQKDPLSIRDIPSTENCEILESIEKEGTVFWTGDMAFGNGSNGGIEPWIKVETLNGTIGWARLIYLCPMDEKDFELKLQIN